MAERLTAKELRRMVEFAKANRITPLHFESWADFVRFVETHEVKGWTILSPEDFGLEPDDFPGDFYLIGRDGIWTLEKGSALESPSTCGDPHLLRE